MKILDYSALALVIIGAINWGLIGLLDFNLVETLFGTESIVPRIIYSLVGITGLINCGLLVMDLDEHDHK